MKKYVLILALSFALTLGLLSVQTNAESLQSADIRFSYKDNEVFLEVSGTTPAVYGQHLNVVVYDPSTDGTFTPEDVTDSETGKIAEDPASICPITDLSSVLRIREITAESDGSFYAKIPVSDSITDGQYFIVQISGGGKKHVASSYIRLFKSAEAIEADILSAFENASASELGELFREYELLLGVNLDSSYNLNKTKIHNLFVNVRDYDIGSYESLNDILKTWDYAQYLFELSGKPSKAKIENFISNYEDIIGYDFSVNNEDYTQMSEEVHSLLAGIFGENNPYSMKDVREKLDQAVAIAMINSKTSSTIKPVIEKYAGTLGIDADEYRDFCEEYSAYEVNKAFVGQDFKNTKEVIKAYEERIEDLKNKDTSSGGTGGSGGGGGGGAPSSSHDDNWMTKEEIPATEAEKPQTSINYSDLPSSHWAYEAVTELSLKGVINGFEDGTFMPDKAVTREQFIKMIVTAFKIDGEAQRSFNDVEIDRWSAPYIKKAVACGIVKGVTEDMFKPEADVTRQDAAVMLYRLCQAENINISGEAQLTDSDEVSEYARESVNALAGAGIINGFEDGSFKPFGALTRSQTAKLIYGLINR